MQIRHLKHFVALAEELHFGKAAARLSITQPPLSFSIRQLETTLGARLFERNTKRVALTPAGRAFLAEAYGILAQVDRAKEITSAVAEGRSGRLDIGFSGSMIYVGLPRLIASYTHRYRDIDVRFTEGGAPSQVDALLHGRLDVGFVNTIDLPEGLEGERLFDEPFVCCLPRDHPLSTATGIDLKSLAGIPIVTPPRTAYPALYDRLLAMCATAGLTPSSVRQVSANWLTIVAFVAEGFGFALVPAPLARSHIEGIRFVPVRSIDARAHFYMVWNPIGINPAVAPFTDAVIRAAKRARRRPRSS